jgi:O-acetylserine/cysteine efflux transporter
MITGARRRPRYRVCARLPISDAASAQFGSHNGAVSPCIPAGRHLSSKAHSHWLKPHHLLLLVLVNFLWGANLLTSKLGVRELPAMTFASLRLALMLLLCLPWLRRFPGQMRNLFMVGLCTGAGGFGLLALGVGLSKDVSTVAIFTQLMVPFTTLLSVTVLGEVIHWRRKTGIALAFLGVFIIGFDPRAFSYWQGLLCVVLQALAAAVDIIYVKRLKGVQPLHLQAWLSVFALPVLVVCSLAFEHGQLQAVQQASGVAWGAVMFAVLGSSLIGQTAFFYLLKRYPVNSVAPLTVLSTVFGTLLGVLINHDQLTGRMLVGGCLTLAGVVIIELRSTHAAVVHSVDDQSA